MNFKYIISSTLLSLLILLSCTEDERGLETQGYLELGVSKNVEVITRGFDVEDQSLAVDICAGSNDSIVKHFSDYNDMAGDRVLLDVGTYKVKVSSNPTSKLEFEQPTFYGEKTNVAVTAGKTTAVSVECFLSCVKVTTEFTKPVQNMFKSVIARVSDKSGSYLDYGLKETRAGYFQPGYILVDLTLTNKEGLEFKMSKLIDKTEARDHYHLVFDMIDSGDDNSGMDFDITIEDDPTNDENHTVTIPLPETGYGQEPPVVKFVDGEGKEIPNNTISKTEDSTDELKAIVKISSENIGLKSVTMLANSSYDALSASWNILDEASSSILSEKGIVVTKPEKLTEVLVVDFSNFATTIKEGTHEFTFVALDNLGHESIEKVIIKVNPPIKTLEADAWAYFATLRGRVQDAVQGGNYRFEYREKGTEIWTQVPGYVTVLEQEEQDGTNITQVLTGLASNKEYEYRLLNEENPTEPVSFTTEESIALYNGNLDIWYQSGKTWYPVSETDYNELGSFWDSSNPGTTTGAGALVNKNPTQGNSTIVHTPGGQSAELKSQYASAFGIGKFAAASLYAGKFNSLVGTSGAKIDFGQPFSSRPRSLHGFFQYTPVAIDYLGGNQPAGTVQKGDMDICSIYIALSKSPHQIDNTNPSTFFDFENDDNIIAYGELPVDDCVSTNGEWKEFNIPFKYKTLERIETMYIIIVASSSKYGDYFTGGDGSIMYLDDLKLVYPNSLEEVIRQ